MPSLKTVKLRIKSIKSTQKITKAMKMVAASKLKRARVQLDNSSHYANKINNTVQLLVGNNSAILYDLDLLNGRSESNVQLLIVLTSDKGLCGSFNQAVCKLVKSHILEFEKQGKIIKILCVGKKGYDILKVEYRNKIIKSYENLTDKYGLKFVKAKEVASFILNEFNKRTFDECIIFYNDFKSVISQIPTKNYLIPLTLEHNDLIPLNIEFEPSDDFGKGEIIAQLLPQNLTMQCYLSMLKSLTGEQAARMTAMENATRNSSEMIKKLNLVFNRTRQAYITKELIEIISGSETL